MKYRIILFLLMIISGCKWIGCSGPEYPKTEQAIGEQEEIMQSNALFPITLRGKSGCINKAGKIVIKPQFDGGGYFSEGLALVGIGKKCVYIDKTGKIVIKPIFDSASNFSEGLASVGIDKKYGYIDKTGKIVIEPIFDATGDFSEGLAWVGVDLRYAPYGVLPIAGKYGYIDKTGKIVIKPQFDEADDFSESLASIKIRQIGENEFTGKYGYIDKTGKIIIEPRFRSAYAFSEGLARVYSNEGFGDTRDFSEGLAAVKIDGKWGYIDRTGKIVINPQFDYVAGYHNNFSEGLACVRVGKRECYIDKTGKIVIKLKSRWSSGSPFSKGLAHVMIGGLFRHPGTGKYGYIDRSGKWVWKPTD